MMTLDKVAVRLFIYYGGVCVYTYIYIPYTYIIYIYIYTYTYVYTLLNIKIPMNCTDVRICDAAKPPPRSLIEDCSDDNLKRTFASVLADPKYNYYIVDGAVYGGTKSTTLMGI